MIPNCEGLIASNIADFVCKPSGQLACPHVSHVLHVQSRVAAVHNCALELKKRRAEVEAEVATAIAKHQTLTDALPWEKQLVRFTHCPCISTHGTHAVSLLVTRACPSSCSVLLRLDSTARRAVPHAQRFPCLRL